MREEELKKLAYEAERAARTNPVGDSAIGSGAQTAQCGRPMENSLRERLERNLHRARREGHRQHRLEELVFLLDKNPEIARILDLVEDLGKDG
jgi:hypothetical protein